MCRHEFWGGIKTVRSMLRHALLERLEQLLGESSTQGPPRLAMISGPATMGKSLVLRELENRAGAHDLDVCPLVGVAARRDIPYDLVLQLGRSSGPERPPPSLVRLSQHDPEAAFPAMTEIMIELLRERSATSRGQLLTIDDIQFVDDWSLRVLSCVVLQLRDEPLTVIWTHRVEVDGRTSGSLRELLDLARRHRFELTRLSPAELGSAVSGTATPDESLLAALLERSGGNPLLVDQLLQAEPLDGSTGRADLSSALAEAYVTCIHRAGATAVSVSRAIAALGDASSPDLLCALAWVRETSAARVVEHLEDIGILADGRFRVDGVADALLRELPPAEVSDLKLRAARLMRDMGADRTQVAEQLHAVGPVKEEWVVRALKEAASWSIDDDAGAAIRHLTLARRCATDLAERHSLAAELAYLHVKVEPRTSSARVTALIDPGAIDHLDPDRAHVAISLKLRNLEHDSALEMLNRWAEVDRSSDSFLATVLLVRTVFPGIADRVDAPLAVSGDGQQRSTDTAWTSLPALRTLEASLAGRFSPKTQAAAEQVLQSQLGSRAPGPIGAALSALVYGDRLDTAHSWAARLSGLDAEPTLAAFGDSVRSQVALARGDLRGAVTLARQSLDASGPNHVTWFRTLATLIEATAMAGDHAATQAACRIPVPHNVFKSIAGPHYLYARGMHHLAGNRAHSALADFLVVGEQLDRWGLDATTTCPWRIGAAEAWLRLDEPARAEALVTEELDRIGTRSDRIRGMALRVLAGCTPRKRRRPLLQTGLALLQQSRAQYHVGRTLADLSQVADNKSEARVLVRRAWRAAQACGADELFESLLPGAGDTRPPLPRARGRTAEKLAHGEAFGVLSQSEQRVAALASQGYSNRDISGKLFLTVSTVEQHLTRVYRKLEISSRNELPSEVPLLRASGQD